MSIWALSDPHLSFGVPNKSMEAFGPLWANYTDKIKENWHRLISPQDLILIPGDISWATHLEDALPDLQWIDALPGTKVMIKGNHDYWWGSSNKLSKVLPPSIHFIYNNTFTWNDVTIGGTRLWDSDEYRFDEVIHFQGPEISAVKKATDEDVKIFNRELLRLNLSLKELDPKARIRIALTHYPPIGLDLKPSKTSEILEKEKIQICVFGHLHSLKKNTPLFGEARGVRYILSSCDYLDFTPIRVL